MEKFIWESARPLTYSEGVELSSFPLFQIPSHIPSSLHHTSNIYKMADSTKSLCPVCITVSNTSTFSRPDQLCQEYLLPEHKDTLVCFNYNKWLPFYVPFFEYYSKLYISLDAILGPNIQLCQQCHILKNNDRFFPLDRRRPRGPYSFIRRQWSYFCAP